MQVRITGFVQAFLQEPLSVRKPVRPLGQTMNLCRIPWQAVKIRATSTFSWKRAGLAPSLAVLPRARAVAHTHLTCPVPGGMLAQTPHSLMGTLLWRAHLGALGSSAPVCRRVIHLNLTICLTGCAICKFYCSQQRAAIEPSPRWKLPETEAAGNVCALLLCAGLSSLSSLGTAWQITG